MAEGDQARTSVIEVSAPLTLNDLAGAVPGMCLMLGYAIAWTLRMSALATTVEIEENKAIYDKIAVYVPESHEQGQKPKKSSPSYLPMPRKSSDGQPILQVRRRVVHGSGKPTTAETRSEIMIPKVGDPPVTSSLENVTIMPEPNGPDGTYIGIVTPIHFVQVNYTPNVSWRSSGVYETTKSVIFVGAVDPSVWAVIGGVMGATLSSIYVGWRIAAAWFS